MNEETGESCGTCRYWLQNPQKKEEGWCRRFPPVPMPVPVQTADNNFLFPIQSFFPAMTSHGYCGEFKRDTKGMH